MTKTEMEIVYKSLDEIMPYEFNPRRNDEAVDYVANSIEEYGFNQPIVIDAAGVIVAGHTRYRAAKKIGLKKVPCLMKDDLTPYQIKAYRLADNKTAEMSDWDYSLLEKELKELEEMDMTEYGFDEEFLESLELEGKEEDYENGRSDITLMDRFIIPPFTTLDARKGYWRERKKKWKDLNIVDSSGRDSNLIGGWKNLAGVSGNGEYINGTSVFDPVLCEVVYRWFNVPNGSVYDCFAGGSVRGIVANILGYKYTGIDLRREQCDSNAECARNIGIEQEWICDNSLNADKYLEDDSVDLLFTCPPYYDLEKYSDDPEDISNMSYKDFLDTYSKILSIGARKVKNDRFAVIVISDVRDRNGFYRLLPYETIKIMENNGFRFYNDMILFNVMGTAPIRASRQFNSTRKPVRTHQQVLVFYKGDPDAIKENFSELDFSETELIETLEE